MTAHTLIRPAPDEYESFYAGYISLVPDGDVLESLEAQRKETAKLLGGIPEAKGGHRYAPDKWSINWCGSTAWCGTPRWRCSARSRRTRGPAAEPPTPSR